MNMNLEKPFLTSRSSLSWRELSGSNYEEKISESLLEERKNDLFAVYIYIYIYIYIGLFSTANHYVIAAKV